MATITITPGQTFASGDTVTSTKLNNLGNPVASLSSATIVNADVSASAAIAHSKLATITAGSVLLGNASAVPTATALTGDVTVNSSGVTAIGAGVIVDADVSASAAIGLSKLATGALPTAITVASANLVDGTIVNADINASAAIDITKLGTSTTAALGVGSIELGHATDTTLSRAAAGRLAVEGVNVVTASSTDTLTNKTLTAPVISSITNTGTLTLPTSTDTLVGRATTDTLTNKSIAIGSNTVTGTKAQFDTAVTDDNFAYTGTANSFTASQTVTGTVTTQAASTQDAVVLQGRAGGTSSRSVTLTPASLTASRTLTLPDTTGTVVTTGDSGTVTSTMIANDTIVDADINSAAAISLSKLATGALPTAITVASANIVDGTIATADIADSTSTTTGVTDSKLRQSAGNSVVGRSASTTGAPADITAGTDGHVLRRSGTTLGFGTVATAGIADAAVTSTKLDGSQTGSAPIFGCRAWVNFDATRDSSGASNTSNTDRFLRASGNVSSVLKLANGAFKVSFTTALPNANYAVIGTSTPIVGTGFTYVSSLYRVDTNTQPANATTDFTISTTNPSTGAALNCSDINIVVIG